MQNSGTGSLSDAEKIFDSLETEKLTKGYTMSESGESIISAKTAFTLDVHQIAIVNDWAILPDGSNRAILQRLQKSSPCTCEQISELL